MLTALRRPYPPDQDRVIGIGQDDHVADVAGQDHVPTNRAIPLRNVDFILMPNARCLARQPRVFRSQTRLSQPGGPW